MAISKKERYEIFKRDNFTCQYCGMSAPDVILEVDHINPLCNGGNDNFMNLVTSCRACNRGKSGIALSKKSEERKSKRYNLCLKPSLATDIEKIAWVDRTSVNALINDLIEQHIEISKEKLLKYKIVFNKQNIQIK